MPAPSHVPLLLLCGVVALNLFASCSKHGSRTPSSLDTPRGSLIGNWLVDGSSIQVITDSGAAHDVRDKDTFRIGPNGMEVLLGSYIQPGGVFDVFLRSLGAKYIVAANTAAGSRVQTAIVVDRSAAHGEPDGTLELKIDVQAVLVDSHLEVTYLNRTFLDGEEQDRDHLRFNLLPGPQVTANLTGTFELTDIKVLADLGRPHPYQPGDPSTFAGNKVTQLLGTDFGANAVLGSSVGDYVVVESFSNAFNGRAEALFMAVGRQNTPSAGLRRYIVFDAIRVDDGMLGFLFQVDDPTQAEDIDALELAMTQRGTSQALLLRHDGNTAAIGKKLVTFVILGGQ